MDKELKIILFLLDENNFSPSKLLSKHPYIFSSLSQCHYHFLEVVHNIYLNQESWDELLLSPIICTNSLLAKSIVNDVNIITDQKRSILIKLKKLISKKDVIEISSLNFENRKEAINLTKSILDLSDDEFIHLVFYDIIDENLLNNVRAVNAVKDLDKKLCSLKLLLLCV